MGEFFRVNGFRARDRRENPKNTTHIEEACNKPSPGYTVIVRLHPVLFAIAIVLTSCAGETPSLIVELRTDYVPGEEFDGIAINGERIRGARFSDDFLEGERVTRLETSKTFRFTTELTLGGVLVESRETVVSGGGRQGVTVVITRNCAEVSCPNAADAAATACLDGVCVSPACTPENPSGCASVPQCMEDVDCAGGAAACGFGTCVAGTCLVAADHDMCSADEFCEPDVGCSTQTILLGDAGIDAGTDAGVDAGADSGSDGGVDGGVDGADTSCGEEEALCNAVDEDCDGTVDEGCARAIVSPARPMQIAGEPLTIDYDAGDLGDLSAVVSCGATERAFALTGSAGSARIALNGTTDPFGRDCTLTLKSGDATLEMVHEFAVSRMVASASDNRLVALDLSLGEFVARATVDGGDTYGAGVFDRTIVYSNVHSSGTVWSRYNVETNVSQLLGAVVYGGEPGPSVVAVHADGIVGIRQSSSGAVMLRREHDAARVVSGSAAPYTVPIPATASRVGDRVWVVATGPTPTLVEFDITSLEFVSARPLPAVPIAVTIGDGFAYGLGADGQVTRASLTDVSAPLETVGSFADGSSTARDLLYDADNRRLLVLSATDSGYAILMYSLNDASTERFDVSMPSGVFDLSHARMVF